MASGAVTKKRKLDDGKASAIPESAAQTDGSASVSSEAKTGNIGAETFADAQKVAIRAKEARDAAQKTLSDLEDAFNAQKETIFKLWKREKRSKCSGLAAVSDTFSKQIGGMVKSAAAQLAEKKGKQKETDTAAKVNNAKEATKTVNDNKKTTSPKCCGCMEAGVCEPLLVFLSKAGKSIEMNSAHGDNYDESELAKAIQFGRVDDLCDLCAAFVLEDATAAAKVEHPKVVVAHETFPGDDEYGGDDPKSAETVIHEAFNRDLHEDLISDQSDNDSVNTHQSDQSD